MWGEGSPEAEGLMLVYEGEAAWPRQRGSREVQRDGVCAGGTELLGQGKKMRPPSLRAFLSRDQFFSLLAEASCLSLLSSQK